MHKFVSRKRGHFQISANREERGSYQVNNGSAHYVCMCVCCYATLIVSLLGIMHKPYSARGAATE
jgi:hypothetical protein